MRLGFIVIIIVLFSSVAYAGDAETVGEATYTWVAVKSDPDVFSNARTALGKIDFKKSTIDGTINSTSIAEKFYNSYGGVLLRVSHGGVPNPACHTLRHSFATHLIEKGYDIRTVSGASGTQGCQDDDDLYACLESWTGRCAKPNR